MSDAELAVQSAREPRARRPEQASPVTLFLVRHGETPQHAQNRYVGTTDAPLTDRGRQQAVDLAHWAERANLAAIISSDLARAKETAAPSAAATGLDPLVDPQWRELDFGSGEGLTAAEMRERFPAARTAFEVDPYQHPLPDGEDPAAALVRARAAADELADEYAGGRVLVVAHGTLLRLLLCDLLGIPPGRYRAAFPAMANTTGAVVRYWADRAQQPGLLAYNAPLRPDSSF